MGGFYIDSKYHFGGRRRLQKKVSKKSLTGSALRAHKAAKELEEKQYQDRLKFLENNKSLLILFMTLALFLLLK